MTKQEYLLTLLKKDGTYKGQIGISPIRYPGGKSRAIGIISQYLPESLPKKILSPFTGGSSLEIAWAKNLDIDEVIGCDVFLPLVIFWQVILSDPNSLANKLESFKIGNDFYYQYKNILKEWYEDPVKNKLSDVDAAAYYYYNMQLSYGPLFLGWTNDKYMSDYPAYLRIIERIRNFSCPKFKVEHLSFEKSLEKYDSHFVYADPPYLLGYDSDVFRPMYPNQKGENHINFNHELFKDLMINRKTEWIISYNECGTIKKWFSNFEHKFPKWAYTLQQGETRKNGLKKNRDSTKESKEILIINSSW